MSKTSPDLNAAVDRLVASWPPLTDDQLDRIAGLLRKPLSHNDSHTGQPVIKS